MVTVPILDYSLAGNLISGGVAERLAFGSHQMLFRRYQMAFGSYQMAFGGHIDNFHLSLGGITEKNDRTNKKFQWKILSV